MDTHLACALVSGCQVPLTVFEALSFSQAELPCALLDLGRRTGTSHLFLLSTCERIELYVSWDGSSEQPDLITALAESRRLPHSLVEHSSTVLTGRDAARHLLRVTAGLESFVLGERDIVGQVRTASEASRVSGPPGLVLERLLAAAVNTSRRVHRDTDFGSAGRSVASAAIALAAARLGGHLGQRRVLVVGAGQVATAVAATASRLGAAVSVCNRTRRHAERFAAAGASVVDLAELGKSISTADLAIFGTASPHPLMDGARLSQVRKGRDQPLLVVDLCVPRNVDPSIRELNGVTLIDLADLRTSTAGHDDGVTRDVARAEQIVDEEVDRYLRWLVGRSVAGPLRRLRADVETQVRAEIDRATRDVPEATRELVESRVRQAVRRLAHEPTIRLLAAADADDHPLVEMLSRTFAATPEPVDIGAADGAGSFPPQVGIVAPSLVS